MTGRITQRSVTFSSVQDTGPVRSPEQVRDAMDARDELLAAQAAAWEASLKPGKPAKDTRNVPPGQPGTCVPDEKTGRCPRCGRGPESRAAYASREPEEAARRRDNEGYMWETASGEQLTSGVAP